MTPIDYEDEVRKVHPEAYGQFMMGCFLIVDGANEDEKIGEIANSQEESWKSAYESLKQTGKI